MDRYSFSVCVWECVDMKSSLYLALKSWLGSATVREGSSGMTCAAPAMASPTHCYKYTQHGCAAIEPLSSSWSLLTLQQTTTLALKDKQTFIFRELLAKCKGNSIWFLSLQRKKENKPSLTLDLTDALCKLSLLSVVLIALCALGIWCRCSFVSDISQCFKASSLRSELILGNIMSLEA